MSSCSDDSFEFSLEVNPLVDRLEDYRHNKILTDVTIRIGEEEFYAHRNVLEDSSPVLKAMLSNRWSRGNVYHLDDEIVDSEIMEDLLSYFYTAKFTLTSENVHAICMAAHFLQIPALLSASENFLSERVFTDNVLQLFLLSAKLQLKTLFARCINCLLENYKTVLEDVKLVRFLSENLQMIMKELGEQRNIKMKELLFESFMKWTENDYSARSSLLPSLFEHLSLHEFSLEFLNEVVATQKTIRESLLYSSLLIDALRKVSMDTEQTSPISSNSCDLYCFGGQNKNFRQLSSVSCLSTLSDKWKRSVRMAAKCAFAGAVVGNRIYLCGGRSGISRILKTMEVFDCSTRTWTRLADMPEGRNHCAAAALNGNIYVSGGWNFPEDKLSGMIRYNIQENEWKPVRPMNEARHSHQLVELNGRLYAIGGNITNTVEEYNPAINQWRMVASTEYTHRKFGATSHNGKIYVHSQEGFEVYSPELNLWDTLTPPNNYSEGSLVSVNGQLWAIGGAGSDGATAAVFFYDPSMDQWTNLPDMNVARAGHCSFVVTSRPVKFLE